MRILMTLFIMKPLQIAQKPRGLGQKVLISFRINKNAKMILRFWVNLMIFHSIPYGIFFSVSHKKLTFNNPNKDFKSFQLL